MPAASVATTPTPVQAMARRRDASQRPKRARNSVMGLRGSKP